MTILGLRRSEPSVCGVCARHSSGIGYANQSRKFSILWLCDECVGTPAVRKVYAMSEKQLTATERKAIDEAFRLVASKIFEAVLGSLWSESVRNLDDLTPEKFSAALDRLVLEGDGLAAQQVFLTGYEDMVKIAVNGDKAPF